MPKQKVKAPARITKAQQFVNKLAPTHDKISCSEKAEVEGGPRVETVEINSRYASHDFGGCYRCTLMAVLNYAVKGELADEEDDEE